ncbi:pilus assembly protein [Halobacillus fulvus]|nr:pilus assembly protein [Halobacillus fulvus]
MRKEKGTALVEFALILPVFLILLFGLIDFGRIFHAYLTIDHAGREGARVASVQSEDSEITSAITNAASSLNGFGNGNITISPAGEANRSSGSEVQVTLTYEIGFTTPFVEALASPITLTDTTIMRVE